jgi:hypothetical protein
MVAKMSSLPCVCVQPKHLHHERAWTGLLVKHNLNNSFLLHGQIFVSRFPFQKIQISAFDKQKVVVNVDQFLVAKIYQVVSSSSYFIIWWDFEF